MQLLPRLVWNLIPYSSKALGLWLLVLANFHILLAIEQFKTHAELITKC